MSSSTSSTSPSSPPTTSTSNNCKPYSPDDSNIGHATMADSTENQEKKVCFICGSQTTLFINIYERRCGPNMIDVIIEKFKMRPLNDDKFLCYSCNNWLINWYSMQNKTKQSQHKTNEDDQPTTTTSSTMSATIMPTKTSDDDTEMVIISDDDDDDFNEHNRGGGNENIDVNNIIQTMRNRLKKYLYYPNRQKNDHQDNEWQTIHPHNATVMELHRDQSDTDRNCKHCGKLLRRRLNRCKQRIFCRSCRFLMRRYGIDSPAVSHKCHKNQLKSSQFQETAHMPPSPPPFNDNRPSNALNHHINIFKKLQQLGTSIYYENEYDVEQHKQQRMQWPKQSQQHQVQSKSYHRRCRHMTSIPHEIDMKSQKNGTKTWQQHSNGSNEILMTFNTVVTEVFPIDKLYSNYYGRSNDDHVTNESEAKNSPPHNFNIQEILRNVPKSLTITISQ